MLRRVLLGLAVLVAVLAVLAVSGLLLLGRVDWAGLAATRAGAALGRPVTLGALRVTPGRWLRIEVEDLALANIEGGSRPEMLTLRRAAAEVELRSLLHGPPVLRAVAVDGLSLLLERGREGARNWRFGAPRPPAEGPPDRSGLPLLLSAAVTDSEILFRTGSGQVLRTWLETAAIGTEGPEAPVLLRAAGRYNDVPVALDGRLESTTLLRQSARPYGTTLRLEARDTRLDFDGTMTDPLNIDGADGAAVLRAPSPDTLLALAGAAAELHAPLEIEGRLTHRDAVWQLAEGKGQLAGEAVAIRLARFTEGTPGQPDAVALDLGFGRLDLNRRLAAGRRAGAAEADLPLEVSAAPDPLLSVRLEAEELAYAALRARDVAFAAALVPGRITVESLALSTSGARLRASGQVEARPQGARIAAEVRLEEGDLDIMRRALGLRSLPLAGRLDGWVAVTAEGGRLNAAARGARVSAVVAMRGGQVAREVIEAGSTDLRLLVRRPRGMTPVACLLGMVEMRAGSGEVAPLRIRSAEGTVAGTASFNLDRRQLDLVIGSERATTGFFALDIPVRVSGSFADPSIRPARWSPKGRARLAAADDVAPLPARLRDFARQNPCYRPGAAPAAPPLRARRR
ncbi:AsmA family protein [Roseicella aquatilis]|uniref:Uncharacterized protein n=1 Tax=Roseicella aquatilis TaxID=2527868 RepID=A0A4R4DFC7_9PROT|nr:AsmA-like C-terminal region-containing protein [Roseicella aquatilis]TCZ58573.1 hypothetical protein EXY23_16685 [Roseicella aquatilis]